MPYAVPTHSPTASSSTTPTSPSPIFTTRANLRRTRSSFTDEQGPGAFVAMSALPRRRSPSKKAVFHLTADDDSPQDEDGVAPAHDVLPSLSNTSHTNGVGFSPHTSSMGSGRSSPSMTPPSFIELSSSQTPVPFPTSSPLASPNHTLPARSLSHSSPSPPRPSTIPRVPSTPIILSNGKPLKSSLKSCSSSPNIASDLQRTKHLRAQSAPSTPNLTHKNVHFPEEGSGLEMVKVFKRSGKPASLSKASGDETETETEAENNPSSNGYPFPSLTLSSFTSSTSPVAQTSQTASKPIIHEVDPSPNLTSAVPHPSPSPLANVHLETITLPRTRPPTLRGTVLVRNLAYEKSVAVRFTLDDWQTTSEVTCRHVVSLPGLPPPFPRTSKDGAGSDVATRVVVGEEVDPRLFWDRFSFTIRLEDYETKLSERTLYLVTRFSSPTGEWWDNNEGNNYRVGFRRAVASPLGSPLNTPTASAVSSPFVPVASLPSVAAKPLVKAGSAIPAQYLASVNNNLASATTGLAQQRTFSAPSALRYTPMTGALAGIPLVGAAGGRPATPPFSRSLSSPYPPGSPTVQGSPLPTPSGLSPSRSQSAPSPLSSQIVLPGGKDAQGRHTVPRIHRPNSPPSPSATQTSSYIKRRLSLSNYVAPGAGPIVSSFVNPITPAPASSGSEGLVTPPITPPSTVRSRSASLPSEFTIPDGAYEQGVYEKEGRSVDAGASKPVVPKVTIADIPSVDEALPECEVPFSPTRTSMQFMNFDGLGLSGMGIGAGAGLMSPPRSRDASEDGGSGEGGRSSPTLPVLDLRIPGAPGSIRLAPTSQVAALLQEQVDGLSTSPAEPSPASASTTSSVSSSLPSPVAATLSNLGMGGSSADRVDTTDSSYAAFVRQWCFAQSSPPTPGVQHSLDASDGPTPKGSPPAGYVGPGGIVGVGKQWNGAGYRFPGFNFGGVSPDAGMVGAYMR